jgi:hypothetical protein
MIEDYRVKSGQADGKELVIEQKVGLWSRSFALRAVTWITMILIVIALALFATAYLSGFETLPDMVDWYRNTWNI